MGQVDTGLPVLPRWRCGRVSSDRCCDTLQGQHAAIIYYWVLIFLFLVSPATAYNFSELIESHAVCTVTRLPIPRARLGLLPWSSES